jgi:hypothetical protein
MDLLGGRAGVYKCMIMRENHTFVYFARAKYAKYGMREKYTKLPICVAAD